MSGNRRVEAGVQLRECTVLTAVFGILVTVVVNLFGAARSADAVHARRVAVHTACQRILDEMRTSMVGAIPIARVDAKMASGWFDKLETLAGADPIPFTRLPCASAEDAFGKEGATAARTGNAVLFARPSRRASLRGTDGREHRVRTYRLVCYYLTKRAEGLDLARFVSERVADATDLEAIDAGDRNQFLRGLAAGTDGKRVRWLWRRDVPATEAVLGIDPETGETRVAARLPADMSLSRSGLLPFAGYSVATNSADGSIGVARLARRSARRGGFPHGFEAQFAGRAAARQVVLHLTVIGTWSDHEPVSADLQSIAVVRER